MKWLKFLLEMLAGFKTKQDLEKAGASPQDAAAGLTTMVNLPTFGNGPESEEELARSRIVNFMRSQIGKVYQLGIEVAQGHEDESTSWDCSECTEAAYRLAGHPLPDGARFQFDATQAVNNPKAGDLLFLWSDTRRMIGHVMVATGQGSVIHAVGGRGVVEDPISRWTNHPRYRGARRHVDFARPQEDRA